MKKYALLLGTLLLCIPLISLTDKGKWTSLLDKDMSAWETYLSYEHKDNYDGKIPKDTQGNPLKPVGYNTDPKKVFSVVTMENEPVLRISGEVYGCIFTRKPYQNYHLKMQVKWGDLKFTPRKNKLKDSGILYHSNGEAGAEYWRTWMLSQEFQVMEGHMGDFWTQANSMIDIRAFASEGTMNSVADASRPFRTFSRESDYFCMRSANHETPGNGWTELELICFENKSIHIVNGQVVMVLQNSRYKAEDGKEVPMTSGKIQLQSEAAEVFYRRINIKPLTELPKEYKELF
jgi:hypothetical protein